MSAGRKPSATIHLPECRDRMLDALRDGASRVAAAESIGCVGKTARRYIIDHPEFAAKVEAAERGEQVTSESAYPAPVAMSRVVVDAEPIDAEPCDVPSTKRPAPTDVTGLAVYGDRLMDSIEKIIDDPDHEHFPPIAKMLFQAIYGPGMLRALRLAEREAEDVGTGDKPQRILVIRVPDNGTRGAGK